MKRKEPVCFIIAGPNGAGKTTFAREFLPREAGCPMFVNADLIAAGLSPFAPGAGYSGRAFDAGGNCIPRAPTGEFALETTLSGRRYARLIPGWQRIGYEVVLIFLWLPKVELAIERVRERVRQGGHDVPEKVIRRRYEAGWRNFNLAYKRLVDRWFLYDNAGRIPVLLEKGTRI